jgi:uncharacterized protein involved in exopolysaccharide biosynthesis
VSGEWAGPDLQDAELPRPGGAQRDDELNPFELPNAVLRSWRVVAALVFGAVALVLAYWALIPRTYTASVAFVPENRAQSRGVPTGIAGLIGQFGISLGSDGNQSPRFYAAVLKGRGLTEQILLSRFPDSRSARQPQDSVTLLELLGVDGRNAVDSLHNGVLTLDALVTVSVDNLTNIVRVNVDSRYPDLAAQIANRLVQYLNEFNAKTRQSQARSRRMFVEARVQEGEADLRQGERDLRTFYERNRSWQESPQLVFAEGQLRRQVDLRGEVQRTLRREYETARIEEVNDTPVITVIEPATPPTQPSAPRLGVLLGVALLFSGFIGVSWAVGARFVERARQRHSAPYGEFVALRREARRQIGRALGALAPKSRRTPRG